MLEPKRQSLLPLETHYVNPHCYFSRAGLGPYKRCHFCTLRTRKCLGMQNNMITIAVCLCLLLFVFIDNAMLVRVNIVVIVALLLYLGYKINNSLDSLAHSDFNNRQLAQKLKTSNGKLADREERFRLAVAGTDEGIYDWHLDNGSIYFSPRWSAMLGYRSIQPNFRAWANLFHVDDYGGFLDAWSTFVLSDEARFIFEYRIKHKEGHYIWVQIYGVCLRNEAQEPYRMAGSQKDVSQQKSAIAALVNAKEEAELANRTKSAFLANMSHELRTPLNAIIGYSEMLYDECGNEMMRTDLDKIQNAGKHLLTLINDVLDLSKVEAGKMSLYLESFDLSQVLDDVKILTQTVADKNRNKLLFEFDSKIDNLYADVVRLRQILFNLVSNACKFTHQGEITISARLRQKNTLELIEISVQDTGIGLLPKQCDALFQKFIQADNSTTRRFGGTGLGLVISQHFAQMMGGLITVESTYGQGSTFTLTLPTVVKANDADSPNFI